MGFLSPGRKCALMAISDACKFLDNGGEVAVSIYSDNLVSDTESTINSQLLLLSAHDIIELFTVSAQCLFYCPV